MSKHETKIVPHDHVGCQGDCDTRFEVSCSCGWTQGTKSRAVADALAVGHRGYSPDADVIAWNDGPKITDAQLRELFARHCECRPLDLTRTEDDHAAIHDCDTAILHDVQVALGIVKIDDGARVETGIVISSGRGFQAMREARERCAEHLASDLARQRGAGP
jgi:hypothetical protein